MILANHPRITTKAYKAFCVEHKIPLLEWGALRGERGLRMFYNCLSSYSHRLAFFLYLEKKKKEKEG